MNEMTNTPAAFGCGSIFDHRSHTPDELSAAVIGLAVDVGWRATTDKDFRAVRRLLAVQAGEAGPEFFLPGATDGQISEHLSWRSGEAEAWLSENVAVPEGHWIGHDGEAFGVWDTTPLERYYLERGDIASAERCYCDH